MNKRLAIFGVICLAIIVFVIGFVGSSKTSKTSAKTDKGEATEKSDTITSSYCTNGFGNTVNYSYHYFLNSDGVVSNMITSRQVMSDNEYDAVVEQSKMEDECNTYPDDIDHKCSVSRNGKISMILIERICEENEECTYSVLKEARESEGLTCKESYD